MRKLILSRDPSIPEKYDEDRYMLIPFQRGKTMLTYITDTIKELGLKNSAFVCGGYMRYCASPRPNTHLPSDIDLFFDSEFSYGKLLERVLKDSKDSIKIETSWTSSGDDIQITSDKLIRRLVGLRITHKNFIRDCIQQIQFFKPSSLLVIPNVPSEALFPFPINFIHPHFRQGSTVQNVLDQFDFTICKAGMYGTDKILVDKMFLVDEQYQVIRVVNFDNPPGIIKRCIKYAKYGYEVDDETILEVLNAFKGLEHIPGVVEQAQRIVRLYNKTLSADKKRIKMLQADQEKLKNQIKLQTRPESLFGGYIRGR